MAADSRLVKRASEFGWYAGAASLSISALWLPRIPWYGAGEYKEGDMLLDGMAHATIREMLKKYRAEIVPLPNLLSAIATFSNPYRTNLRAFREPSGGWRIALGDQEIATEREVRIPDEELARLEHAYSATARHIVRNHRPLLLMNGVSGVLWGIVAVAMFTVSTIVVTSSETSSIVDAAATTGSQKSLSMNAYMRLFLFLLLYPVAGLFLATGWYLANSKVMTSQCQSLRAHPPDRPLDCNAAVQSSEDAALDYSSILSDEWRRTAWTATVVGTMIGVTVGVLGLILVGS